MKPAPFGFVAATTVDEAIAAPGPAADEDAKVNAGGQHLLPLVGMRLARSTLLVDLNGLGHDVLGLLRAARYVPDPAALARL